MAPGGRTNRPFGSGNQPPRVRPATQAGGSGAKPPKKDCCPMVAALRSARKGKFRLAKRYTIMSVRLMAARISPA
jgi:hypothetical protein